MRRTLIIARQEFLVNVRRPGFIIMTLLIPALGLVALLVASLFGGQVGSFFESQFNPQVEKIGYVDHSGIVKADLPQHKGLYVAYADETLARADMLAGRIDSYFVLPEDYLATGTVKVYAVGGGFSSLAAADSGDLRSFLLTNLLAGEVDDALLARATEPANTEAITLTKQGEISEESPFSWIGDFLVPYLFSILFVVTIFTASGFLLQSVSEEKEGRIIEILLSSVNPTQLLAGKILGLGALGLLQVLIWIAAGAGLLMGATALFAVAGVIKLSLGTVALGLLYFVLGYLLFATLMATAGSMGTTQRESQQISGIFSMAAAVPWMTMGMVLANPDSALAVALSYFPLTAPVMMLLRMSISTIPPVQIAISLASLIAGIVISLWAGAKIFRGGLLMYGKRLGVKEIVQAFKQA